jgi:SAM-dependent methyltransferase/predicted RNA-binding Zn-ribbon protein involved in translation (DUF1610 family)
MLPSAVYRPVMIGGGSTTSRPCPMCGTDRSTERHRVHGWAVCTCDDCGFLFCPVIPDTTAVESSPPADFDFHRPRYQHAHRLLERSLEPDALVVEIGAGFGTFGQLVEAQGYFRYSGFEPSHAAADVASRRGVQLRRAFFRAEELSEPADAIVIDNVLEHVADPVGILREAARALKPDGLIVIVVPNRHDLRRAIPAWRREFWIPPEHINYFRHGDLRRVLSQLGFRLRPFGFAALTRADWRYWPRAAAEASGLHVLGLSIVASRSRM